jgi:hypothetical protein
MLYSTAVLLFYRPLVSMNAPSVSDFFESRKGLPARTTGEVVIQEIRTAAFRITEICSDLSTLGLVRFLMPVGVTVASSAAVVHLAAIYSPFKEIHAEALAKLSKCLFVIEQLQDLYIAADLSCYVLYSGLKNAGIPLPQKLDSISITKALQQSGFDPAQAAKNSFGNLFDLLNSPEQPPPPNMSSLAENAIIFNMDPTATSVHDSAYRGLFMAATG